jgi:oligoribonuclease NrnB/cAMP/cGMP phosphodiesterase (DHH superfamily)
MPKTYVLFHDACFDGTGAKYSAWKKFGDKAEYIPVQYGQPLPELTARTTFSQVQPGEPFYDPKSDRWYAGSLPLTADVTGLNPDDPVDVQVDVFICDFSYPRDVLEALRARVNTLVILDHHKTAEEALRGFPGAIFDMNKSGAVLTWEYFHPGVRIPELLRLVQDRDLWKWELGRTGAVTAALPLLKGDMKQWDLHADFVWEGDKHVKSPLDNLTDQGSTILAYNKIQVENALKDVVVLPFRGYKAGVRNWTGNASDLGNAICKSPELGVDFSLTYFIGTDGNPVFSFRSLGDMDVSALAKGFSGGGHKNAAGCKVTLGVLADLLAGKL